MQPLMRRNRPAKADPAPSRWAWRMQRLMLTPAFRLGLRAGLPFVAALSLGTWYLGDEGRRTAIEQTVAEARESIESRPEFMVKLMAIDGAEEALANDIRVALPMEFPMSSFDMDLAAIREKVTQIDAVKAAAVRIKPGGVLQVDVTPREPVAVWRTGDGVSLVDEAGVHVAWLYTRADRPDLPLIAGEGANDHVAEAMHLIRAASPLGARLRGVVRVGERRWDLVLDREQRILLPAKNPVPALERVIALESAQDILTRDVARVDMRLARRPTVQMNSEATAEWWLIKEQMGQ
ncbi:MAG: cell division protein FtsQ/DivIB [Sulfitobacter sp.]